MKSSWLAVLKKELGSSEEEMMLSLRSTGTPCATITEVVPWEEQEDEEDKGEESGDW
jgi:hypothetical protein